MMMHISVLRPAFVLLGLSVAGCAGTTPAALVPSGATVHRFFADALVVRGTAEMGSAGATCADFAPPSSGVLVELTEDTRARIRLGHEAGNPPLGGSVLRIRHLSSNRTWCVTALADGTPAAVVDEFPEGLYALTVTEPGVATPPRYQISLGKL